MKRLFAAMCLFFALAPAPLAARSEPSSALRQRAVELVPLLNAKDEGAPFFDTAFLAHVPLAQVRAIARSLVEQNGPAQRIESIEAETANDAIISIGYARATVSIRLVVDPKEPNLVTGLIVTGSVARDDTIEKLVADVAALPGAASLGMVELGAGNPRWIAAYRRDAQMAIGSGFKLYVLAELARQAAAGTRRWSDVVPLGPPSLASGITQKWPLAAPMTLHSLATLMISVSDNTATDTLIDVLGRAQIEEMMRDTGHAGQDRAMPLLKTVEAFSLKMPANDDLRLQWEQGDLAARRRLLAEAPDRLRIDRVDFAKLGSAPTHIGTVEWFASPTDLIAILDRLRTQPAPEARAILAVNSGVDALTAARFDYIGYKGGSENGVIALNYLVRDRRGRWFAVAGAWNDPTQDVSAPRFNALMLRALALAGR